MIEVAVLGATGYTGVELVRLLYSHPRVKPVYLTAERYAGRLLSEVHGQFRGQVDVELKPLQVEDLPDSIELVFCALPHGSSAGVVPKLLQRGKRVIDLSADFRLKRPVLYEQWYGRVHPAPELLAGAVYGLPELNREAIAGAELLANPGCYPTAALLALAPLAGAGLVDWRTVVIDAKSGVSGAGRSPRQDFHFPDCTENFKAYRVTGHQHTPEIEQELSALAGCEVILSFIPHLVPMVRGILCTVYLKLNAEISREQLYAMYKKFYGAAQFVRLLAPPALPETRLVRGSNFCDIALCLDERNGRVIILSAIDNLTRGASGQAVQNMNIMLGLPEKMGLEVLPI